MAEAAAVHKQSNDAAMQNRNVLETLSNAIQWMFIHVDQSGYVKISRLILLGIARNFVDLEQAHEVDRFIAHIVKCAFDASSPTPI